MTKKNNIFIVTFYSILIILIIFARYNGNSHSEYVNVWSYLYGDFKIDMYENMSLWTKTSIFYPLLKFINVNLQNDIQGIFFHYLISLFAAYYLLKILKTFLNINDYYYLIFLLLILSSFDNVLIHNARSGWVYQHTLVPSHLALCFSFYYLWQLLNKNKLNLFFSSLIFLLINIKVAWFMIFCGIIFIYLENKKLKDLYWLIPCFIFAIYSFLIFSEQTLDKQMKLTLFKEVIRRDSDEVALHLQSNFKLLITVLSFFLYFYFLKFLENKNLIKFSKYVLYSSILLFVVGGLFTKYGEYIYPDPRLAILSPVRSMYVYQFFFVLLFLNYIKIKFENKQMLYVYLSAPFFISYGYKGFILYAGILVFLFLLTKISISKKISYFLVISFILSLLVLNSASNRVKKMDFYTFKKLNHWSTFVEGEETFKDFFLNLRNCKDFMIYDDIGLNRDANFFSKKSRYYKPDSVALGSNYYALLESKRREKIINLIKDKNETLSNREIEQLSKENFLYLSKSKDNNKFFTIKKEFGNLIFIFEDKQIEELRINCKGLI